jgi:type I restriction enzyme S subunit
MVRALYDYWFVQFDFSDENGKPYKSSGGEMIWSEDLKRKIPKDWGVKKLEDIFEFKKGVEPGSVEYLNSPINEHCVKFFRVGDIEGESSLYIDSRNKKYLFAHEKDIVVSFDGSVGKVGIGLNGAISGGLRKVHDKYGKLDNSLVYFIFKDKRIIATIHKYAAGSILLHASSSINHLKIAYKEKIYLEFQEIIQPIYDQIIKNKKENQKLAELRDFLLPMLMNGQVSIK